MNLSDVVGQLMRDGGLSPATATRVQHSMGEQGLGGLGDAGGIGGLLNNLLGGAPGSGSQGAGAPAGGGGGLAGALGGLGDLLSGPSGVGGMSRGQVGGIGAVAGALLGGGSGSVKGAVGGGAMALLGTLALSALKNWQAQGSEASQPAPEISETEIRQMTAPETAELCLRGMIEAVKSDGRIAPDEVERIVGKLKEGGITEEEQQFVVDELRKPPDVQGLLAAIPNREVGAQVYAAALMAITVDTQAERAFLGEIARGTGVNAQSVQRLHSMVGAPSPMG